MEHSISELEKELDDFVKFYENSPEAVVTNSFFGHLNFEEWTQLIHKHAIHHLKQFGVPI
jgi:hypothetical protein